jgi:hypothetical protein
LVVLPLFEFCPLKLYPFLEVRGILRAPASEETETIKPVSISIHPSDFYYTIEWLTTPPLLFSEKGYIPYSPFSKFDESRLIFK